ncbi:MAG: IS110 family transposase, partial [Flavobacteriales bacterium]|nr:IS110 family transposase [Flavobacteriales bacterium]
MEFKDVLGIDVSKSTVDVWLHTYEAHNQFENTTKGFKLMIRWVQKLSNVKTGELLICMEHTGIYSLPLASFLADQS